MAKVSLKNVSKLYSGGSGGAVPAVQNFDLEVADREFLVLVGPSGSGKSTMLRMIAGLEKVSLGEIFIGEKKVNDVPAKDRDIGMVFQNYALYPHMTAYENLVVGLQRRRLPKTEVKKRVQEAAGILGIESLLERKPKALSGGEQQRVAVGRAMVCQPKVFLFDEPLSNLDAKMRLQMRSEITKLHQRLQATMIYVTHDQGEAMTMGDRIVVMREGVVQQVDAPLALYQNPVNQFVAGFLGSPPMNFIHGKLKDAPDGAIFKEKEGGVIDCKLVEKPAAREFAGREVVLGVRPENVRIVTETGRKLPGVLQGLIEIVEPLGSETHLSVQTGAHTLIVRSPQSFDHGDVGHRLRFEIETAGVLLFDPATGRRLA